MHLATLLIESNFSLLFDQVSCSSKPHYSIANPIILHALLFSYKTFNWVQYGMIHNKEPQVGKGVFSWVNLSGTHGFLASDTMLDWSDFLPLSFLPFYTTMLILFLFINLNANRRSNHFFHFTWTSIFILICLLTLWASSLISTWSKMIHSKISFEIGWINIWIRAGSLIRIQILIWIRRGGYGLS